MPRGQLDADLYGWGLLEALREPHAETASQLGQVDTAVRLPSDLPRELSAPVSFLQKEQSNQQG